MVNTNINLVDAGINSTIAGVAKPGQRELAREGVGLRLLSLRGSWVQIPPPAFQPSFSYFVDCKKFLYLNLLVNLGVADEYCTTLLPRTWSSFT